MQTDIGATYRRHEILLTGGNGFVGKVLLGLLLDRFPDLKHLHILVRPKGAVSAEERFRREVLASPALAGVVEKRGAAFLREKISVIAGDVGEPGCGIHPAELHSLAGRVGLVINCAGLVEFFPPVDESFRSNVYGVEHVVELAKELRARLLHVSTCYVCGEADGLVEESDPILGFYPRRTGPHDSSFRHQEEIRICRERTREILAAAASNGAGGPNGQSRRSKEIVRRLVELGRERAGQWGWVNTYTYSKSLGEQIIAAEPGLKYAIVRPAIVESALRFPFPGWVEGGRTAAPLVLMAMDGLKEWTVRKDAPLEVVPVDLVASSILVVGALLLDDTSAPVYQLGTADINPLLLEPLVTMTLSYIDSRRNGNGSRLRRGAGARFLSAQSARARRVRLQRRIGRAQAVLNGVKKVLEMARLPGGKSVARWKKTLRAKGLQASFRERTLNLYHPFILHNRYIFESENIRAAHTMISEQDRQLLPWDPERIDWEHYWIQNQVKGIEKWIQPEAVKEWNFKL